MFKLLKLDMHDIMNAISLLFRTSESMPPRTVLMDPVVLCFSCKTDLGSDPLGPLLFSLVLIDFFDQILSIPEKLFSV